MANPPLTFTTKQCQYNGQIVVPLFDAPWQFDASIQAQVKFGAASFWPNTPFHSQSYGGKFGGGGGNASMGFTSLFSYTISGPGEGGAFQNLPQTGGTTQCRPAYFGNIWQGIVADANIGTKFGFRSFQYIAPLGINVVPMRVASFAPFTAGNNLFGAFDTSGSFVLNYQNTIYFGSQLVESDLTRTLVASDALGNSFVYPKFINGSLPASIIYQACFAEINRSAMTNFLLYKGQVAGNKTPCIVDIENGIFNIINFINSPDDTDLNNNFATGNWLTTLTQYGFILVNTPQSITPGQNYDAILLAKDGSYFYNIRFNPQTANSAALVANTQPNITIDPEGIVYMGNGGNTISVNAAYSFSPGNLDFGITVPQLPPISLPCNPGCWPVPLDVGIL